MESATQLKSNIATLDFNGSRYRVSHNNAGGVSVWELRVLHDAGNPLNLFG